MTKRPYQGASTMGGSRGTDESSQPQVETTMKLFAVRLSDGNLLQSAYTGQPLYFDDKMQAKKMRNQHDGAVVVLGPDHNRSKEV